MLGNNFACFLMSSGFFFNINFFTKFLQAFIDVKDFSCFCCSLLTFKKRKIFQENYHGLDPDHSRQNVAKVITDDKLLLADKDFKMLYTLL